VLSTADNELLTRVGPGTPMGALLRQYWHPVLLASELPEPDGTPLRVRALGEDLVAVREASGGVGLLRPTGPHLPSEWSRSDVIGPVRQRAYLTRQAGGVVWAYFGDDHAPPPLPDLEWIGLPTEQRFQAKRVQQCNWVQALEGDIDQSHVSFAHRRLDSSTSLSGRPVVDRIRARDTHPRFEALDTPYGVLIGAGRADGDQRYWRITQFLMPFWSMTGPYGENPIRHTRAWLAMDDETTMVFSVTFHPLRPLTDTEVGRMRAGSGAGYVGEGNFLPATSEPGGAWRPKARLENDYFLDRQLQKTTFFSGIPEFWAQDAAMQESMGPIYDRTREHLGSSDMGIIRVRQRLIRAAKALRDQGLTPPGAREPELYQVRGAAVLLPAEVSWIDASADHRKVLPGVNQAGV